MKSLFSSPFVSRLGGAVSAGVAQYVLGGNDWKAAAGTAVSFLIYGGVHSAVTAASKP